MKKNVLRFSAAAMALVMAMGMSVFADDDPAPENTAITEIKGDSITVQDVVTNPIIKVTVPTKINFTIDALNAKSDDQVSSGDMIVINESDVPVKVDFTTSFANTLDDDVVVKKAATDVSVDNPGDSTQEVYLTMVPAKTLAADDDNPLLPGTPDYTGTGTEAEVIYGKDVSTKMSLYVGKPTVTGSGSSRQVTAATFAAMKIAGTVNPYATWGTTGHTNLPITAAYTITGLSDATQTALTSTAATKQLSSTTSKLNALTLNSVKLNGSKIVAKLFSDSDLNLEVKASDITDVKVYYDSIAASNITVADGEITIDGVAASVANALKEKLTTIPVSFYYKGKQYSKSLTVSDQITGVTATTKKITIPIGSDSFSTAAAFDATKLTAISYKKNKDASTSTSVTLSDITTYELTKDSDGVLTGIAIDVTGISENDKPVVTVTYDKQNYTGVAAAGAVKVQEKLHSVEANTEGLTIKLFASADKYPTGFDASKVDHVQFGAAPITASTTPYKFTVDSTSKAISIEMPLEEDDTIKKTDIVVVLKDGTEYVLPSTASNITVEAAETEELTSDVGTLTATTAGITLKLAGTDAAASDVSKFKVKGSAVTTSASGDTLTYTGTLTYEDEVEVRFTYDDVTYTATVTVAGVPGTVSAAKGSDKAITITLADGTGEKKFASFKQLYVKLDDSIGGTIFNCLKSATEGATDNITVSGKTIKITEAGWKDLVDTTEQFAVDYVAEDGKTYTIYGSFPS